MESYTVVAVFMAAGALFVVANMFVGSLIRPHNPYEKKLLPYECGHLPVGDAQVQYHVRYYLFALIFIIFEVESVFLYPWGVVFSSMGWPVLVEMLIFLLVLVVGLVYAWRKKVLQWV